MSEKARLLRTLFRKGKARTHVDIKFCRGSSEDISEEDFCREINGALFQIDNGLSVGSDGIEEDFPIVDIAELVSTLDMQPEVL